MEPQTFQVECPGCEHVFTITKTPEQLDDEEDLTECPECEECFESEFLEDDTTLVLIDPLEDEDFEEETEEDLDPDDE
jgi:NAD-dependent SIR2 family protein deacetylase